MPELNEIAEVFKSLPIELSKLDVEMLWCREVLIRTNGNKTHCSEILGVSYRTVNRYVDLMKEKNLFINVDPEILVRRKRGKNKEKKGMFI